MVWAWGQARASACARRSAHPQVSLPTTRDACTPEKHYPGVLGHLLPSGVVSILGAVSALWRADEFLERTGETVPLMLRADSRSRPDVAVNRR